MATVSQITPRTLLKIKKIAVLTDFSENADLALRYAAAFARGYEASLVLAHAYVPPYYAFAAPEANLVYQAFHDLSEDLSARLKAKASATYLQSLRCTTLLREGAPKDLLDELHDADLIVVGTSGATGFEKAALGSTAEAIFRSSKV
ncbi:MAG TPA: universal stress protein, partial [Terriglobales bacterium]|nr:universal stress protein [Terriglobales bacterium]